MKKASKLTDAERSEIDILHGKGYSASDVSMFVKITINNRGEKDQSGRLVLSYMDDQFGSPSQSLPHY